MIKPFMYICMWLAERIYKNFAFRLYLKQKKSTEIVWFNTKGRSMWGDIKQQTFKPTALNFKRLPCGSEWVFCRLTLIDSPPSHLFWHMNGTEGSWDYRATRQAHGFWEDSTSTPDTMRFWVYRHPNRYDRHENSETSSILHLSVFDRRPVDSGSDCWLTFATGI